MFQNAPKISETHKDFSSASRIPKMYQEFLKGIKKFHTERNRPTTF